MSWLGLIRGVREVLLHRAGDVALRSAETHSAIQGVNPPVASFNEFHRSFPVGDVGLEALRQRRWTKIVKGQEELDFGVRNQVLKQEVLNIPVEVFEETKEVLIEGERFGERT